MAVFASVFNIDAIKKLFDKRKPFFLEAPFLQLKGLDGTYFPVLGSIIFPLSFGTSSSPLDLPFHVTEDLSIPDLLLSWPEIFEVGLFIHPGDEYIPYQNKRIPLMDGSQSLLFRENAEEHPTELINFMIASLHR